MIQERLWRALSDEAPEEICLRTEATMDAECGRLLLRVMDATLVVDVGGRRLAWRDAPPGTTATALGTAVEVSACSYLLSAKAIALAGRWVSPLALPSGEAFFRGPHALPTAGLEATFGDAAEAFRASGEALGGNPLEFADVAFEFQVFPRLPVAVLLWSADDEFPARARFLVDETAGEHLAVDALLGVLELVADRLVCLASL